MNQENLLNGLQNWFMSQCDGTWEHRHGIKLETVDNPGWKLKIDLKGTSSENASFERIRKGNLPDNVYEAEWIDCYIEDGIFHGAGSSLNDLLEVFLRRVAK